MVAGVWKHIANLGKQRDSPVPCEQTEVVQITCTVNAVCYVSVVLLEPVLEDMLDV